MTKIPNLGISNFQKIYEIGCNQSLWIFHPEKTPLDSQSFIDRGFPGNGLGLVITWSRVTDNDLDIPIWNLVRSLLKVPYICDIRIPIQLSAFHHRRGFVSTCFGFHSNYSINIIFNNF